MSKAKPMMTLQELQSATINSEVAREAHQQTARRLEDLLSIKAAHEQKAVVLLGGYITLSLALFSTTGFFLTRGNDPSLIPAFLIAGALFVVGAICAVLALMDSDYGVLGSHPDMWLTRGVIDGKDSAVTAMLAYLVFFHQARIDASAAANRRKADYVRRGIYAGIAAPVALGLLIAWL